MEYYRSRIVGALDYLNFSKHSAWHDSKSDNDMKSYGGLIKNNNILIIETTKFYHK